MDSVHNPETLFRDSLERKGYSGDKDNNTDICDYLGVIVGLDKEKGESLEYKVCSKRFMRVVMVLTVTQMLEICMKSE